MIEVPRNYFQNLERDMQERRSRAIEDRHKELEARKKSDKEHPNWIPRCAEYHIWRRQNYPELYS
jgi:hypothetical protein